MKCYKDSTEEGKKYEGFSPLHLLIKNLFKRLHAPHFWKLLALLKTYNISTLRKF